MSKDKKENIPVEKVTEEVKQGDELPSQDEEQILILKNTIENLQGKIALLQADSINYRKRKDEEVSNMLRYANQDLILELLPIADNFERAIKLDSGDQSLSKFLDGFKILYTALIDTLNKYGVIELNVLNKPFDANLCEALMTSSDSTKEEDLVVEVLLKGYSLKGRVIRPAKVIVNKI